MGPAVEIGLQGLLTAQSLFHNRFPHSDPRARAHTVPAIPQLGHTSAGSRTPRRRCSSGLQGNRMGRRLVRGLNYKAGNKKAPAG